MKALARPNFLADDASAAAPPPAPSRQPPVVPEQSIGAPPEATVSKSPARRGCSPVACAMQSCRHDITQLPGRQAHHDGSPGRKLTVLTLWQRCAVDLIRSTLWECSDIANPDSCVPSVPLNQNLIGRGDRMNFRKNKLCASVRLALGALVIGSLSTAAFAQEASADQAKSKTLETVTVTGLTDSPRRRRDGQPGRHHRPRRYPGDRQADVGRPGAAVAGDDGRQLQSAGQQQRRHRQLQHQSARPGIEAHADPAQRPAPAEQGPERHSRRRHRAHRSTAHRCVGNLRLGRHRRRRELHPAQELPGRHVHRECRPVRSQRRRTERLHLHLWPDVR